MYSIGKREAFKGGESALLSLFPACFQTEIRSSQHILAHVSNFSWKKLPYSVIDSALRVAGLSESACWAHCWAYPILGKKYFKILANKQKCVHWPLSPHFCSTFESLTNDIQSIVTKSTLSLSLFKVEFRPQKPKIYCRTYWHYLEFSLNCLVKTAPFKCRIYNINKAILQIF